MNKHPEIRRLERLYSTIIVLQWFSATIMSAVSVLLAQQRGLSLADIGLYSSVFSIVAAVMELPTGGLADRVGRKRVTLWSLWLNVVARTLLLFAGSLPLYLFYALLGGTARALGSGALEAWFIGRLRQLDPEIDLQPVLARNSALTMLALGTGSLVGGLLPSLAARLHLPFNPLLFPVGLSLAGFIATGLVTAQHIQDETENSYPLLPTLRGGFTALPDALRHALALVRGNLALKCLLLIELVLGIIIAASETYWQPYFAARFDLHGPNTTLFGVILAGCYGAGVLGNLGAAHSVRWTGGPLRLGMLSLVLQGLGLILLTNQRQIWLAVGLLWLTFWVRNLFVSSHGALYNAEVPDAHRSLMLSVMSVAFFLGVTLGNAVLGYVSDRYGISMGWIGVGIVTMLSATVLWPLQNRIGEKATRLKI